MGQQNADFPNFMFTSHAFECSRQQICHFNIPELVYHKANIGQQSYDFHAYTSLIHGHQVSGQQLHNFVHENILTWDMYREDNKVFVNPEEKLILHNLYDGSFQQDER